MMRGNPQLRKVDGPRGLAAELGPREVLSSCGAKAHLNRDEDAIDADAS